MIQYLPVLSTLALCSLTTVTGQSIIPGEEELILTKGARYELTCEHTEKVSWELPSTADNFTSPKETREFGENGRYRAILKFTKLHFLDTGFYTCVTKDANSEESPSIYLFIADPDNLFVTNSNFAVLQQTEGQNIIIPCRPTSPFYNVTLWKDDQQIMGLPWDPKNGFNYLSAQVSNSGLLECKAVTQAGSSESIHFELTVHQNTDEVPKPIVKAIVPAMAHAVIGQEVLLECEVTVVFGTLVHLAWKTPHNRLDKSRVTNKTKTFKEEINNILHSVHLLSLMINNTKKEDSGPYICTVEDSSGNTAEDFYNLVVDTSESNYLNLTIDGGSEITVRRGERHVQWIANIIAHPAAKVSWLNPNGKKMMTGEKYSITLVGAKSKVEIDEVSIEDSGLYVLQADNSLFKKTLNITLLVEDEPNVLLSVETYYLKDSTYRVKCAVLGYPIPAIEWVYSDCSNYPTCSPQENPLKSELIEMPDGVHLTSVVTLVANQTRKLTCRARNFLGTKTANAMFFVTDVADGFSLWGSENAVTSDDLKLTCGASKYHYRNDISWNYRTEDGKFSADLVNASLPGLSILESASMYSYLSTVVIKNISKDLGGYFTCQSTFLYNVSISRKSLRVTVKELAAPYFTQATNLNGGLMDVDPGQKVIFYCFVDGSPFPVIVWFKNGISLDVTEDSPYVLKNQSQALEIQSATKHTVGRYACIATNKAGIIKAEKTIQLFVSKPTGLVALVVGVVCFVVFCSVVIVFLCVRIRKERKKYRDELSSVGLYNFASGHPEILNPNLDIYEQAENLPYNNEIWEFPRDKLKFSRQLGSGAFGVVVKAEASGLNNNDQPVTVAVKMVKQNSHLAMIKNLASELKILAHLGKHINIVNLIGACTDNIKNRELLVIVEYCKFGNLHNYLQKHRSLYINQVNSTTGDIIPLSRDQTAELKSLQDGQSNYHKSVASDYSVTSSSKLIHSSSTPTGDDGYLLSRDMDPGGAEGYYQGDYKASNIKPICTQDLLCWAYQVANGMDYLASRKVMHGDLAARNVLLAEDNIVKICDFGLAKNMYKDDNYLKKGADMLPVKWLSIEALKDRIFSTQSDIWSYGVVLWEFFSLAMTPYPGLVYGEEFLNRLVNGYRMEQPNYCPDPVYKLMLECWNAKPMERPSFAECSKKIESLLQDSVREHYMGLNDIYLKLNGISTEQEDYLAMLNNPTFENMTSVTNSDYVSEPSYVNVPNNDRRVDAKADQFELEPMLDKGIVTFHNPGYGELPQKA